MKNLKNPSLLVVGLIITFWSYGQKPITLEEKEISFTHGSYPGLSMTIPEVRYNDVSKAWTKILEKGTKSKIQIENGEITIFGAQIDDVYPEPINLYSLLSSADSAITLEVTFELKPKDYLDKTNHPAEYTKARTLLFNMGKDIYVDLAKSELDNEEKALRKLERDLDALYREKTRLEKSIVNDNSDIQKLSDDIVLRKQDASNLNNQLGKERELLTELEGEEAIKEKEAQIADLEKDKDKALGDVESNEKKILLRKSDIEKAKLDIETNSQDQTRKLAEIELQKEVTLKAQKKYETILGYQ